ncbi:MAG: ATP-binding cassette domain-containing protein [Raineya sp.]|nr:ATP-binding cassette domain-containing protein [Raineya sp.]
MTEEILKALMQLFGITASLEGTQPTYRYLVENFLQEHLSREQVHKYLLIFEEFSKLRTVETDDSGVKLTSTRISSRMLVICTHINQELTQQQKLVALIKMIELIAADGEISPNEWEFIHTVASIFNFEQSEVENFINFITIDYIEQHFLENTLYITPFENIHYDYHLYQPHLQGFMLILRVPNLETYIFKYIGEQDYYLNGFLLKNRNIYFLSPGSVIRGGRIEGIYYSDIVSIFRKTKQEQSIYLEVRNVSFLFAGKKNGVRNISFTETGGKLLGIMGESGAGKSTLLEVLNGNFKPQSGKVLINGYDVHQEKLEGIIGYVPQDDLLIENLSVYDNLYYAAKLSLGNLSETEIENRVEEILRNLGLQEVAHLQVGSPLERTISGGQRKRLNIGLELLRKPAILFVDEPTSGLSSRDSENIMDLLKELALEGKLVVVVIHQPSATIFKMFDKLLILDTGGYPIYYGSPIDAVPYFRKHARQVSRSQSECSECGNIDVGQIFDIVSAKIVNEYGRFTEKRKISPQQWFEIYQQQQKEQQEKSETIPKFEILNIRLQKPNHLKQWWLFLKRDLKNKVNHSQYLLVNLLQAPLLAFGLSYVNRYHEAGKPYYFGENENIPAYIFIAIIVALFSGLVGSAEQIISDRKILKREAFLHLSRNSYLLAKVAVLFLLSFLQTLALVWIGNWVLDIRGMGWQYFAVLFSCSAFANVLGLLISDAFKSAITVYILIPLLLIPQLVLGGIVIRFDKVNPDFKFSAQDHIPWFSELLASRWAFEALMVVQFKDNRYEKPLYTYDKIIATAEYKKVFYLPELQKLLAQAKSNPYQSGNIFRLIRNELTNELEQIDRKEIPSLFALTESKNIVGTYAQIEKIFLKIRKYYKEEQQLAQKAKDEFLRKNPTYQNLRKDYHNEALARLVKQLDSEQKLVVLEKHIEPIINAVYIDSQDVSAHFFAPNKQFAGYTISTLYFNIAVLWIMVIVTYWLLYFRWLAYFVKWLGNTLGKIKT